MSSFGDISIGDMIKSSSFKHVCLLVFNFTRDPVQSGLIQFYKNLVSNQVQFSLLIP